VMIFERSFTIESLDDSHHERIRKFWKERGIGFVLESNTNYVGHRGNLIHNLFAFDMQKLRSFLRIDIDHAKSINVFLNIDTRFQYITEWNHEYFVQELEHFSKYVKCGVFDEFLWTEFIKESKRKSNRALLFIFILSFFGALLSLFFIEYFK
jgi:hypothetical protein